MGSVKSRNFGWGPRGHAYYVRASGVITAKRSKESGVKVQINMMKLLNRSNGNVLGHNQGALT